MIRLLLLFIILFGSANYLHAQEDSTKPRLTDFAKEIQKVDDHNQSLKMCFWMPWQYWETAMSQALNGSPLPVSMIHMVDVMKQYTIVCVIDAEAGVGGLTYKPESDIRDSIRLIIKDSIPMRPLDENKLDQDLQAVLTMLRPMMKNMMGKLGDNMAFYVFENTDKNGKYLIDASNPGRFTIKWTATMPFSWRLPLEVYTPPKYCPVDNEKLSGKFEYCPYHGSKLKTNK